MKYLFLFLSAVFLLFAVVQFNDPDPILWICIYLITSIFSVLAFLNKFYPRLTLILVVLSFLWAAILFPPSIQDWWVMEEKAASLKMKMPGIEEARESMGMIISGFTLLIVWWKGRKFNKKG